MMRKNRGPEESEYARRIARRLDERVFELFGNRGRSKYAEQILRMHPTTVSKAINSPIGMLSDALVATIEQRDPEMRGIMQGLLEARARDSLGGRKPQDDMTAEQRKAVRDGLNKVIEILQDVVKSMD